MIVIVTLCVSHKILPYSSKEKSVRIKKESKKLKQNILKEFEYE